MPPTDTEKIPATLQPSSLEESGTAAPSPVVVQTARSANLPTELVCEIVQLGIDDGFYGLPIAASQVCSRWRTATLGSPFLWTSAYIHNLETDDLTQLLLRAEDFAARSGSRAMSVYVDLSPPQVFDARSIVSPIVGFFSHYTERIRQLTIRYTPEFRDAGVSAMVSPALAHRLEVCVMQAIPSDFFLPEHSEPYRPSTQIVSSAFQCPEEAENQIGERSPDLEELSLTATALVWSHFAPRHLRCLVLQDLTLRTAPTWVNLWHMLEANGSTLVHLELSRVHPLGPRTEQPLELPALRKLRISYIHPSFLFCFYATYRIPHLLELHLHDEARSGANARNRMQSKAFAYMMEYIPLQHLQYLHLSEVSLLPDLTETVQIGRDPLPIALFRRLCALTKLKLTNPDPPTLGALNTCLPHLWCTKRDTNADGPLLLQVVPNLVRLSLRQVDCSTLEEFLATRAEMKDVCKLELLDVRLHWQALEVPEFHLVSLARNTAHNLAFLDPLA